MPTILLINTSFSRSPFRKYSAFGAPLGILSIAAALMRAGYGVRFVDPQVDDDYRATIMRALAEEPLFVGMSVYLGCNVRNALELSCLIREEAPAVPIVWGGPFASSVPEICLRQAPIDFVVMGTGEITAVRLAHAFQNAESPKLLEHVSFLEAGTVSMGEPYGTVEELDSFPFPQLDLWEQGIRRTGAIPILSSRGCPRNCSFCYNSFTGKRNYCLRSPESVLEEMELWARRFNIADFHFVDDNFLLDTDRATRILSEMARRKWTASRLMAHLDEFRRFSVEALVPTVKLVIMCVESASARIQQLLNKVLDTDKVLALIERLTAMKIGYVTAFMFGLPTETDADIRQSIELAERIRSISRAATAMCYIYAPQPGDGIVRRLGLEQAIDFSLDAVANIEVIPSLPNDIIDLRLRPWLRPADVDFYLVFVRVWLYHFDPGFRRDNPAFDPAQYCATNKRVSTLFRGISAPG